MTGLLGPNDPDDPDPNDHDPNDPDPNDHDPNDWTTGEPDVTVGAPTR